MMTKVAQLIFDEGIERGKEEGKVEGKAAGQAGMIHCIRRKHEKNYEASVIAEILEQKIEYVKKICQLIEESPECTDIEIARKYLACEEETDIK